MPFPSTSRTQRPAVPPTPQLGMITQWQPASTSHFQKETGNVFFFFLIKNASFQNEFQFSINTPGYLSSNTEMVNQPEAT